MGLGVPSGLSTDLVEKHCPTCFIHYAAPRVLFDQRLERGGHWYCPNGHSILFTTTEADKARAEADKLRHERDRLKQNEAWYDERLKVERKRVATLTREMKSTHTRVGNGVCPCCNRSFSQLRRHMSAKHPEYVAAPALKVVT